MPFIEELKQAEAQAQAAAEDAWCMPLARVKGKISGDGIERISAQSLLDILEVPEAQRKTGTFMRLRKVMVGLGWYPIKARGLTQSGFRDQIRGYARDRRGACVF